MSADAEAPRPPPGPDAWLHDLVRDVRAKIDAAIVARPPKLVPPKKVDVRWKLAKVGSLDLGAPLVTMTGTDLDSVLRNLNIKTIVGVGVSVNIAIQNFVMDAVNRSYQFVLPRDAVAGYPREYAESIIDNTLALLTTVTTTDAVIQTWKELAGS